MSDIVQRRRGYIPHVVDERRPVFVTFRLADALPIEVLERWHRELADLPTARAKTRIRTRVETYLDEGHGERTLADPRAARIVQNALQYFDGERYTLHAWCVMPTHVHTGLTQSEDRDLSEIVKSWKSFTAREINKTLGRSGRLWQRGYWDRWVRDEAHFKSGIAYIHANPVKAGLCQYAEEFPWSSAAVRASFADCRPPEW